MDLEPYHLQQVALLKDFVVVSNSESCFKKKKGKEKTILVDWSSPDVILIKWPRNWGSHFSEQVPLGSSHLVTPQFQEKSPPFACLRLFCVFAV